MNANFKILITGFIIIVVAYFLIKKRQVLETFKSKTLSGKECIPWKNGVQYKDYGDTKQCKNPERDVNGNWCYTDTVGNYEYCNDYEPSCMKVTVLDGCFTPDKEAYQIVIHNSQPFSEKFLELDKIVDSTNQLWCLDKSGRFLRSAKKSDYLNFEWGDMISDSFNNYDPNSTIFFLISGFGVKKGGYVDTQKNNKDEEVNSLMASEVCYMFLRNYFSKERNCLMRCILSEKINIQSLNPNYHINIGWRNSERNNLNLGKKMMIDDNGNIFAIHKEKVKNGKGINWGDMVIGMEDDIGEIKFSLLGDTFPAKLSQYLIDNEYSVEEDEDENPTSRRFLVNTNQKFFSNEMLSFIHRASYTINELMTHKDTNLINNFMDELAGKNSAQLSEQDNKMIGEFNKYLKYRIILNKDFKFKKDDGTNFTYDLTKTENGNQTFNPLFDTEDVNALLNELEEVKLININRGILSRLDNLKYDMDFKFIIRELDQIEKLKRDKEILESLNPGGTGDFNLRNLQYSHITETEKDPDDYEYSSSESTPGDERNTLDELKGILKLTKNIKLTNQNARLVNSLKNLKKEFDNNTILLKNALKQSKVNIKYNAVVDKIKEIETKLGTPGTERETYISDVLQIRTVVNESKSKKIYYKIISKMMDYFVAKTQSIYDSIERTVENMNEIIDTQVPLIKTQLSDQPCYERNDINYKNYSLINTSDYVKNEFKKNGKIRGTVAGYYKDFEYLKKNLTPNSVLNNVPLFLIRAKFRWGHRYFVTTLNKLEEGSFWGGGGFLPKNEIKEHLIRYSIKAEFFFMGYNSERIRVLENLWKNEGHLGVNGKGRYYTISPLPDRKELFYTRYRRFQEYLNNIYNEGKCRKLFDLSNVTDDIIDTNTRDYRNYGANKIENFLNKNLDRDAGIYNTNDAVKSRLNENLRNEIREQVNVKFNEARRNASNILTTKINELKKIIKPHPRQQKGNVILNLSDSMEKIENLSNYSEAWSTLPNYILRDSTCTYEYTPDAPADSPVESTFVYTSEKNCFQDFVTREVVDLSELEEKITEIKGTNKLKYTDYNVQVDGNVQNISSLRQVGNEVTISETRQDNKLLPELVVLLGELQFATSNLARKEGLLRYYSNFFYMMDKLIEKEKKTEITFNDYQEKVILKMFKLFFDKSDDSENDFEPRAPPIASEFEEYENINDIYNLENLYNIVNLSDLLPDNLDDMYKELAPAIDSDHNLMTKCGDVYSKKEFVNKINIIEFSLNEVMIDYRKRKAFMKDLAETDFNFLNDNNDIINFKFSTTDKVSFNCRVGKDIQFEKLLVNYIRDDVAIFEQGDVNVLETYVNLYTKLKKFEDNNDLNPGFTFEEIDASINELKRKVITHYTETANKFYPIIGDDNSTERANNTEIIEFLNGKNITIDDFGNEVKFKLKERLENLNLTGVEDISSLQDSNQAITNFKVRDYKLAYIELKKVYPKLNEHYLKTLEFLLQSFPNINIVNFSKYLNDYNRCASLDIIRKLEILDETQKIMGEISNMVLHEGLNLGVVDFNLTKDYLYIDFLSPSSAPNNEENISNYDWDNTNSENIIRSLSLVSVRLNKAYIDEVFENNYTILNTLKYIDEGTYPELVRNEIEGQLQDTITLEDKVLTLYEKDEQGQEQKTMRENLNIGRVIFSKYNTEFEIYKDRDENSNNEYESVMRQKLFDEVNEEVMKNFFVEQGRAFIKQNVDDKNKLHVQIKEYDSSLTARKQTLDYLSSVNDQVVLQNANTTTDTVRYFFDYSDKEEYPNLLSEGESGSDEDKMLYQLIPGSLGSGTGMYGMMSYNFSNGLYIGNDKEKKLINKIHFKHNVFFQIYGKKINSEYSGPIELINKTDLAYIATPYIKYSHGLSYTQDGKIKESQYYGLLYWFYLKQKQGKFVNRDEWYKYYKTIVLEGLYNIAADPYKFRLNTNFKNQFEEYVASLQSKPDVGKLSDETLKILKELKDYVYDKELKLETNFPQIKLHRLKSKRYSNQVLIEVVRFNKDGEEVEERDREIVKLVKDFDENTKNDVRKNSSSFMDKYLSHIQDRKNNISFDYKYYRLVKENKFKLLSDSDFCENSERKNKYNSLWRFKVINNFSEYKSIVEGDKNALDEPTNRTKGLYDINNIYKDKFYYEFIKQKRDNSKDVTIVNTANKILKDRKKNMLEATGYPFMVIYQVRDYDGYPCQEGNKNSQKIFLTCNLKPNFIFTGIDEPPDDLINQKEGPIISEEFLAYTGMGSTVRFGYQKVRGNTPLKTDSACNITPYAPLPGYSDECGVGGGGCSGLKVGKTRLDGTPICALDDKEVKSEPVAPLEVSVTGNVLNDDCDIYKVKGNKKIKYTLGKMFGYNDAGKYQLKNQYTLKYGDYYFYYRKKGNKILFKDEFITDPSEVSNYAFNLQTGEDKYGFYVLLSPHLGPKGENTKYLTRVINIFDKHFDEWKLEKKMDKVKDKKKDYVRDVESTERKIIGEPDVDFYAQKFNLPDDATLKIAAQEGFKSELINKMKENLAKSNYLFCNMGGQGENPLCKGDFNSKPELTLDEENEILRKQATQITSLMKRFDNVPETYFENNPQNAELQSFMKKSINTIKQASTFVYKRIKDVNWVVKTQLQTNQEANKLNNKRAEKISDNRVIDTPMDNTFDEKGLMEEALKGMGNINIEQNFEQPQCKSLEEFSNMSPGPSVTPERVNKYDRNIGGRYYNYVQDQIKVKKDNISALNEKIHNLLSGLNKMSDGMDLSGEKKQMLLSEMIQEKNKLEKMMFDIKNFEQQDRLNRIGEKLTKVENIRSEMEEDDFMTQKPQDDANNVSIISREDGEFLNMYRIEDKRDSDHLVFLNGGCLEYESDKKNIKIGHCQADMSNQQFKIVRMDDKRDMENYNLKNSENGIEREFDMVMSKDGMCLHKENGELSFRNCDNVKNQYWDYSNITGPCKM